MDTQTFYEIRIEGHLNSSWSSWFEGMDIYHQSNGETVLCGPVVDQSALHGVLIRIRDLGLPLVAIRRMEQADTKVSSHQATEEERV